MAFFPSGAAISQHPTDGFFEIPLFTDVVQTSLVGTDKEGDKDSTHRTRPPHDSQDDPQGAACLAPRSALWVFTYRKVHSVLCKARRTAARAAAISHKCVFNS